MVGGKPLVGSPQMQPIFAATHTKFTPVQVDGVEKLMARRVANRLRKSVVQEPGLIF
jgi:hypothetical protein